MDFMQLFSNLYKTYPELTGGIIVALFVAVGRFVMGGNAQQPTTVIHNHVHLPETPEPLEPAETKSEPVAPVVVNVTQSNNQVSEKQPFRFEEEWLLERFAATDKIIEQNKKVFQELKEGKEQTEKRRFVELADSASSSLRNFGVKTADVTKSFKNWAVENASNIFGAYELTEPEGAYDELPLGTYKIRGYLIDGNHPSYVRISKNGNWGGHDCFYHDKETINLSTLSLYSDEYGSNRDCAENQKLIMPQVEAIVEIGEEFCQWRKDNWPKKSPYRPHHTLKAIRRI